MATIRLISTKNKSGKGNWLHRSIYGKKGGSSSRGFTSAGIQSELKALNKYLTGTKEFPNGCVMRLPQLSELLANQLLAEYRPIPVPMPRSVKQFGGLKYKDGQLELNLMSYGPFCKRIFSYSLDNCKAEVGACCSGQWPVMSLKELLEYSNDCSDNWKLEHSYKRPMYALDLPVHINPCVYGVQVYHQ